MGKIKGKKFIGTFLFLTTLALVFTLVLPFGVRVKADEALVDFSVYVDAPVGEIIEVRDQYSKYDYLGVGVFSLDASTSPVHYKDSQGDWQRIDNSFVPAVAPWDWEMTGAGYQVKAKEDITAGQVIEFGKKGQSVSLQPMGLQWVNSLDQIQAIGMPLGDSPIVSNTPYEILPNVQGYIGSIEWEDTYGEGIGLRWETTPIRLSKRLEIESFASLPFPQPYMIEGGGVLLQLDLIFEPSSLLNIVVDGQVWDKKATVTTFDAIAFKYEGETLWFFAPLRYWDSNDNIGESVATLRKVGNKLYTSIKIPWEWLQSASFPICIDIDIDEDVAVSANDAYERAPTGASQVVDIDDTYLVIKENSNTASPNYYCSGALWSTSLPSGASIIDAYQQIYYYGAANNDVHCTIYGHDADNSDDFANDPYIYTRDRTTEGAKWDEDNFPSAGWYGSDISCTDVVQELADRPGFGGNVTFLYIADVVADARALTFAAQDRDPVGTQGPQIHIEYSVGADISNTPASVGFGTISESSSYWSSGSAPVFPLDDGECYFTLTNNSAANISVTINSTNFSGGDGWSLVSASPGSGEVVLKAGKSGDATENDMVVLNTTQKSFISALPASNTTKWELKLETGVFTDGVLKEATLTLVASLD